MKLVGPDGLGYTTRIRPDDPQSWEAIWKETEDRLPSALQQLDDGTALEDQRTLGVLRTCLAIHMARSQDLIALDDLIFARLRRPYVAAIAGDPGLAASFPLRHGGLGPAGDGVLRQEAERMYDAARRGVENSSFEADRMHHFYQEAMRRTVAAGLQVCVADEGEFLITDAPAQAMEEGRSGVGVLRGVSWSAANTIIMPFGRQVLVALSRSNEYIHLSREEVGFLNGCLATAAHRWIAWHPDGELLEDVLRARGGPAVPSLTAAGRSTAPECAAESADRHHG